MKQDDEYRAYLVRLWPTRRRGAVDYRVTLESVPAGDRRDFADLESLFTHWRALRARQESAGPTTSLGPSESIVDSPDSKS